MQQHNQELGSALEQNKVEVDSQAQILQQVADIEASVAEVDKPLDLQQGTQKGSWSLRAQEGWHILAVWTVAQLRVQQQMGTKVAHM